MSIPDPAQTPLLSVPDSWLRPNLLAPPTTGHIVVSLAFLTIYVVLDWATAIYSFNGFDITPWQPPTGLSLALLLLLGLGYAPLISLAPLLADIILRGGPAPWYNELLMALIIGGVYSIAAKALTGSRIAIDVSLRTARDVFVLIATTILAAAVVGFLWVLTLAASGLIQWDDFDDAILRYWIGDVIGVVTTTPLLLIIATRLERPDLSLETLFQAGAVVAIILLTFGSSTAPQLDIFYLLFLPVVWIALRHGFEGACYGLLLAQVGLIVVIEVVANPDLNLTTYQGMMLVLAVTGLAVGITVTERRRAEQQLLVQQDAQARIKRLGSIGELAAALTHEINQPLAAATTYSRLAVEALEDPEPSVDAAHDAAMKAATQLNRTVRVVKELREFIQLGRSHVVAVDAHSVIRETLDLLKPMIDKAGARVRTRLAIGTPLVLADPLHLQQVLVNIVQNASDAMLNQDPASRLIVIESSTAPESDTVEFGVRDAGPGFPEEVLLRPFEPFATTKAHGLGIGLALSRTMIEAQGGRFSIHNARRGAVVSFTLKKASPEGN